MNGSQEKSWYLGPNITHYDWSRPLDSVETERTELEALELVPPSGRFLLTLFAQKNEERSSNTSSQDEHLASTPHHHRQHTM